MKDKLRFRQPGKKDKEQVMKLVRILYEKDDTSQIEIWNKGYSNYLPWTYVAEINGQIIGYVCLGGTVESLSIGDLCVLPKFRNKGIASKLIELSIARAEKANKEYIEVNAHRWNETSQKLYKKFGFEIIGETERGLFRLRKQLQGGPHSKKSAIGLKIENY